MPVFKFELDDEVKIKSSGFVGKITGRSEYLYGPTMYLVSAQSRAGENKPSNESWFYENNLFLKGIDLGPECHSGIPLNDK